MTQALVRAKSYSKTDNTDSKEAQWVSLCFMYGANSVNTVIWMDNLFFHLR